jgi:hypothetical protein
MEITSLNSVNQSIFVMVKSCVLFEVGTEYVNIISSSFGFKVLKVGDRDYFLKQR